MKGDKPTKENQKQRPGNWDFEFETSNEPFRTLCSTLLMWAIVYDPYRMAHTIWLI